MEETHRAGHGGSLSSPSSLLADFAPVAPLNTDMEDVSLGLARAEGSASAEAIGSSGGSASAEAIGSSGWVSVLRAEGFC